ncbi:MAG: M15 family metallopeptidase [Bacilli bacterium]|nr:M15 family metallopeptidase [Bacilli bacterium]
MKTKTIYLIYILLLLILISISQGLKTPKKNPSFIKQLQKNSIYKKENKNRYLSYKNKYPNITNRNILIYTNIGLDQEPYSNIKIINQPTKINTLVNKYNYLDKNYIPDDLELVTSNIKLRKVAKKSFEKLVNSAKKENLYIIPVSGYRSYIYQEKLYNKYSAIDGKDKADTYSARPGHSEHQTGLAIDVCTKEKSYIEFENTIEFKWMQENAHKYGFILRYPKNKEHITTYQYEPWHYRYVGVNIATNIYQKQITFDEYYTIYLDK